ncbi:MAG TPA: glycosyltransferase [Tepidisphaeraceae bacterium]|nr:glycosyltransferase [Tepidisphaeraceae bacterium]
MHAMFIHPNFPAQFGHAAHYLSTRLGWQCTCVTQVDSSQAQLPFNRVTYCVTERSTPSGPSKLNVLLDNAWAVYGALKSLPQLRPDIIVGHLTYGTLVYLKNLYECPMVGYYELMPPPYWSNEMALRPEFPPPEHTRLFNATFHAMNYLQGSLIDAAYTPTRFQLDNAPDLVRSKARVIHDGVDMDALQRREIPRPTTFHGVTIGANTRVVTYAARGLESVRGFDIFMKVAKRISQEYADVVFLIAGDDHTYYGHEMHHIRHPCFRQYVLSQDQYHPAQFIFLGMVPPDDLATLFSLSDLHIYLTVPFVLSWSLIWAMAAGCTLLASDTPPLREAIDPDVHGLLHDFHDVDGLAAKALAVLKNPPEYRHLGQAAVQRVRERYELNICMEKLVELLRNPRGG